MCDVIAGAFVSVCDVTFWRKLARNI
jgi:hypothetical protein